MKLLLSFIGISMLFSCSSQGDIKKQEKEYMIKAKTFADNQLWDSAIYYSQKALELNDSSLYLINIGTFYLEKNMPKKAIEFLDSALKLDPNNGVIYYSKGMAHKLMGDTKTAIAEFEKALILNPNDYRSKVKISKLYFDNEQYNLAIKYLNEMIIKEPQKNAYKYYRGKSYGYIGKDEDAIKDFNEILKADSLNGDYLYGRAMSYAGLRKTDLAIADLKKVIAINPNDPPVSNTYFNIAYLYLVDKKDKKKACEYIHLDAKLHNKEVSKEDLQKYCGK
jgi:tetratricopeptide (TPR) repeat protein